MSDQPPTPTHTIRTRPPTEAERAVIVRVTRQSAAPLGCVLLLFGPVSFLVLGAAGRWLGSFAGEAAARCGQYLGWGLATQGFLWAMVSLFREERAWRRRARADVAGREVQEVHVRDPRVVQVASLPDFQPILCFDIGEDRLLYLQGEWMYDPCLYTDDPPRDDPDRQTLNGLTGPLAFPSTEFTVVCLRHTGRVLGIRPSGAYLKPEGPVDVLEPEYRFRDSELLDGRLDDLARALMEAQRRRRGG